MIFYDVFILRMYFYRNIIYLNNIYLSSQLYIILIHIKLVWKFCSISFIIIIGGEFKQLFPLHYPYALVQYKQLFRYVQVETSLVKI